jgi:hypothetical protein
MPAFQVQEEQYLYSRMYVQPSHFSLLSRDKQTWQLQPITSPRGGCKQYPRESSALTSSTTPRTTRSASTNRFLPNLRPSYVSNNLVAVTDSVQFSRLLLCTLHLISTYAHALAHTHVSHVGQVQGRDNYANRHGCDGQRNCERQRASP